MKKLTLLLMLLSLPLLGAAKKMPKTKLSNLKVKYNQLIKKPVKNEAKIRDIIRQVRPVNEAWAQEAAMRLNFIIAQSKGGGIQKNEEEEIRFIPGVPTPPEYLDKPEPDMPSSKDEEYEKAPKDMPDFPAIEIPVDEPPAYEEFEEQEALPAYEASARKRAPASSHKVAHHTKKKARNVT